MSAAIRDATASDWDAIKRLLAEASLPTEDLDASAYALFQVCERAGAIGGAIALQPLAANSVMLRSLVVASDARGNGTGRALVERVEGLAHSKHVHEIFLLTTTADRFFARLGYERVDREVVPDSVRAHQQFRSLCPASAVIMRKVL